ncbi:MAG: hypothetical protein IJY93_06160 [Clostridia bacterium]|nr:hypothetical protein [Clostridia bacterium]
MKKKRLLSLLLAATLISSSIPMTAISAESASGDTALDMDKWGTVTVTSPEKVNDARPDDTDGKYLHVGNVGTYGAGLTILPGKTLTLTSGKYYKISFYARKMDTVNAPGDMKVRFLLNGGNPDAIGNVANQGISKGSITLSSDWQEYWIVLQNANKTIEKIELYRHWNTPDVVPFDVDEFSIVEVTKDGSNWVPVTNGTDFNSGLSISVRGDAVLSDVTDTEFYSIGGSATENTSFAYGGSETLSAGVYEISGKFRLPVFDYSKVTYVTNTANGSLSADNNSAKLSLTFNGDVMKTTDGSDALTVTNEWVTGKFTLEVTSATPASAISFALDSKQVLDFDDITIKQIASYSDDFASVSGKPAIASNDERDGDNDSLYMSFVGEPNTGREYKQSATDMPAGTYTVSFWARAGAAVNYPSGGDGKTTLRVLLNGVEYKPGGQRGMALSTDWKYYSFDVATADANSSMSFELRRHWYDDDGGVAIFIDDISIVEKGTTTNLYTGAGNWDTASGVGAGEFAIVDSSTEFYTITADGANTNFKYIGADTLEAGIYHISGEYRVAEYDFNNPDGVLLTASCGGNAIKTTAGEDGILVGSDWSKGSFFLKLTEATAKSEIVFMLDGAYALDFKDVVYEDANSLYLANWADGNGSLVSVAKDVRDGDTDNGYIHVSGAANSGAVYSDASVNLVDGARYKLTFFARTTPFINSPADSDGNVTLRISMNGTEVNGKLSRTNLTTDWKQYTLFIDQAQLASGSYYQENGVSVRIFRHWFEEDGVPYDIDGVTLVQIDDDDNPISDDLINPGIEWVSYLGGIVEEVSLEEFYRVPAPSVDTTSIECLDNIELEPGVYHISGKFRLPTFDFNGSSAELSAYVGGVMLPTAAGNESAALSADWSEVTFVLDTMVPINMNSIRLMLNDAVDFDFYDLRITLVEHHANLSDVNPGLIVTLLLLKEKAIEAAGYVTTWKANNEPLETVDAVLDEATGKVGAENGTAANSYIRFANRDSNFDKLIYKNDNVTLKPGSYKVSFWARTAPYINAPATNPAVGLRMYNGSVCISSNTVRRSSQGSFYGTNSMQLNTNWTAYSIVYSVTEETPMTYSFNGTGSGYGIAPFDIDGFTVVAVDPGSNKPITGENLAVNSNKIKGMDAAGWTTENGGIGVYELTLETYVETEYLHARAVAGTNTELRCASSRKLAPGTYYVTAKVRLAILDYAKYTFESGSNLSTDDNKAVLTAALKGTALKTADGADSVSVTSEWTDAIFVVNVTEETSLRELTITADSAVALDFDYINIDTKIKKETAVDTSEAGDWSNGDLSPLPAITDGNFLEGALDADKLPYWECGEQTLTALTDDEGNPYFAATNIKNNTLGFTYNPGYALKPGLYKLSVDIRTSSEGENGIVRMLVNDQYKCYSTAITNEWRTVQMAFEVKSGEYLTVKLYGGIIASSVQDYEFKNLTLVDVVAELEGQNLAVGGSFDDETSLEGWIAQSEAKLTWNKDGYLTISDRASSLAGGVCNIDLGFVIPAGTKFKVSYDIRASKVDETFKVRTFIGKVGLDVEDYAFAHRKYEYYITNEWEHVDSSYVSVGDNYLKFVVQGGVNAEDIGDIDIDNIVIEIVK